MLAAARRLPRPFDVLLVDDSSRDLRDALRVVRAPLRGRASDRHLARIDSTSDQAEVVVTVHGMVDGLYVREMAAKIKRGLRGQHESGYATGVITYGYDTVPARDPNRVGGFLGWRIEVNEAEAEVVRQVFEWHAAGVTL